jgi:hypothetical protein
MCNGLLTLAAVILPMLCAAFDQAQAATVESPCSQADRRIVRAEELRKAMNGGDPGTLASVMRRMNCRAPTPKTEIEERYATVRAWSESISLAEAQMLARRSFADIDARMVWWDSDLRPEEIPAPLRFVAEYIRAMLVLDQYLPDAIDNPLDRARRAGDYLLKAQAEAGEGLFPFPAWRGKSDERLHKLAERFLSRMEREGRLAEVTRNGWVISDLQDGGLGFDNGLAGEALVQLHERSGDRRYLDGAIKAGEWALTQPMSENFNYNGFPALLTANLYRATGEKRYLDAALRFAKVGVISGQRRGGDFDGWWIDPHNARLNYRYLMMRQLLGVLEASMKAGISDADVSNSLVRGFRALEVQQRRGGGLGNAFSANEAYCDLYLRHDRPGPLANWPSETARMAVTVGIETLRSGKSPGPTITACSLALANSDRLP